ncbi:uncharacterized protein DNG_10296 [Cephalotrichum gorgonifer]|uniref:Uncharacterized protein n=1 Tax=Cephalotrichum gorgonifer TaxID=2041049 RepID=A0AAE8N7D2_9PEZI|nr:uncharacterized protein DNG_10296 [Cephalotrichum gorgonifer]
MERGTQEAMTSPTESDRGWMSDPSDSPRPHHRLHHRPRASPYSGFAVPIARQNASVQPVRSSWTWGPGPRMSTRQQYLASRRQSPPARFQRLSRSTSPRRTLRAGYFYGDLLHEALQQGDSSPFPAATAAFSLIQGAAPPFAVHHLWPSEDCAVPGAQQSMDGVLSLPVPEAPLVYLENGEDDQEQQDDSDDSFLDEPYQMTDAVPRLEESHRLYRLKDRLVQRAQNLFAQSQRFIPQGSQRFALPWQPMFSCPFFSKDPEKYWPCLEDTSTATILGVKRHLWHHHSQPYYCPVCYDTFPLASERDTHILGRTCAKKDEVVHFDGMSPEQRALIATKERGKGESGPRQWWGIWKILFGRPREKLEPFLPPALSWNILLVTEFWKARGKEITEQFLGDMERMEGGVSGEGRSEFQDVDENTVSGLVNAVLRDLVGLTFWRSGLVRNLGNIIPVRECSE